ncbi:MAG: HU family DNA-binding protein [Geodermatophilaceae bacterium]|nr:HU family DNA-binding protein [Geodermatophilaceae bacterium]
MGGHVNKAELIDAVAAKTAVDKKSTGAVVEAMVDAVLRAVASGERVAITGFGVFEKRARAARTARNPRTGVAIRLKKTSVPAFRPGQGFKDVVSGAKRLTKTTTAKRSATASNAAPAKKAAPAKRATTAKKAAPTKRAAAKVLAKKAPAKKPATKKAAAKVLAKKPAKRGKR